MPVSVEEAIRRVTSFAAYLPSAAMTYLEQTVGEIRDDMKQEGDPVTYPISWDSDRQRTAFFASGGFGKGIPTGRTGQYQEGWRVDSIANGFALSNPSPAAAIGGYPSGEQWQSSIHRGRWIKLATVVAERIQKIPKLLTDAVSEAWNRLTK